MKDHIVSIDQGTTGTTVLVVGRNGDVEGRAYSEFEQHYPRAGWVEHDAEEIWSVTLKVAREAIGNAGIASGDVAAIGITNQRETTVLWEKGSGRPIARAIVWQCRRTAPMVKELVDAGRADLFRNRTGLVLDAYFSGTKIAWLLDQTKSRARAERGEVLFGTIDSWLIYKLTGGARHVTDPTNASRTLIYDIHRRRWDPELLEILGIPAAMLPEVVLSSGDFGTTDESVVGAAVPIRGVAGDQQAALFGQSCVREGMIKNTYGTGSFLMMPTGGRAVGSRGGLLTTLGCDERGDPLFALEGSVFISGAAVQWLRDGLGLIASAAETARVAQSVPDSGGVHLVPAFVGLGAPYWDMDARGGLLGITRGTRRAHVVRAALEAIAFQSRDVVEVMAADTGSSLDELRVDGGAAANDFLMQLQADVLGIPVDRPAQVETTALGAAYLAGLGCGLWSDPEEVAGLRRTDRRFEPSMDEARREEMYAGWKGAVERVLTR